MRARRLPASEPVSLALPSSSTSSPSAGSSVVTASAIARSRRDGDSISHRRTKSSTTRARSSAAERLWVRISTRRKLPRRAARRTSKRPRARRALLPRGIARLLPRAVVPVLARARRSGVAHGRLALLGADDGRLAFGLALAGLGERRTHELAEQRLRAQRPRLELGVILRRYEERMVGQLDDLDEALVRRGAGADKALMLEPATQVVVHLVAVAVALVDDLLAVDLLRARVVVELHRV